MALFISVNLQGNLGSPVTSTTRQKHTVSLSKGKTLTREILHTNREETECVNKVFISDKIMSGWVKSECPKWAKPSNWKRLSNKQKITEYTKRFDEGFGLTVEEV